MIIGNNDKYVDKMECLDQFWKAGQYISGAKCFAVFEISSWIQLWENMVPSLPRTAK